MVEGRVVDKGYGFSARGIRSRGGLVTRVVRTFRLGLQGLRVLPP